MPFSYISGGYIVMSSTITITCGSEHLRGSRPSEPEPRVRFGTGHHSAKTREAGFDLLRDRRRLLHPVAGVLSAGHSHPLLAKTIEGSIEEVLYLNPRLKVIGILLSKLDRRLREEKQVAEYLRERWGALVFATEIGTRIKKAAWSTRLRSAWVKRRSKSSRRRCTTCTTTRTPITA